MKKFLIFTFTLIIFSCSDQNDSTSINIEELVGKWSIDDAEIKSIEFNISETYIVVKEVNNSEEFQYGDFDIVDDSIILEGFGQINDVRLNNRNISLTLSENNQEISLDGRKRDETILSNSSNNDLFKTWSLVLIDGQPILNEDYDLHFFISQSETYFVTFLNEPDNSFLSNWNWKSMAENLLCYSHDGETDCEGTENQVKILELTSSRLVMDDIEAGEIYTLEAL